MEGLGPISPPLDVIAPPALESSARRGQALKDLEGLFLQLLLKEMRKAVPQSGLYGKSPAQAMFQEMLDEVYAQKMAESGQLGIAAVMERQIELQSKQGELRAQLLESSRHPKMMNLTPESPAPVNFPPIGSNEAFQLVKPKPGSADMGFDGLEH